MDEDEYLAPTTSPPPPLPAIAATPADRKRHSLGVRHSLHHDSRDVTLHSDAPATSINGSPSSHTVAISMMSAGASSGASSNATHPAVSAAPGGGMQPWSLVKQVRTRARTPTISSVRASPIIDVVATPASDIARRRINLKQASDRFNSDASVTASRAGVSRNSPQHHDGTDFSHLVPPSLESPSGRPSPVATAADQTSASSTKTSYSARPQLSPATQRSRQPSYTPTSQAASPRTASPMTAASPRLFKGVTRLLRRDKSGSAADSYLNSDECRVERELAALDQRFSHGTAIHSLQYFVEMQHLLRQFRAISRIASLQYLLADMQQCVLNSPMNVELTEGIVNVVEALVRALNLEQNPEDTLRILKFVCRFLAVNGKTRLLRIMTTLLGYLITAVKFNPDLLTDVVGLLVSTISATFAASASVNSVLGRSAETVRVHIYAELDLLSSVECEMTDPDQLFGFQDALIYCLTFSAPISRLWTLWYLNKQYETYPIDVVTFQSTAHQLRLCRVTKAVYETILADRHVIRLPQLVLTAVREQITSRLSLDLMLSILTKNIKPADVRHLGDDLLHNLIAVLIRMLACGTFMVDRGSALGSSSLLSLANEQAHHHSPTNDAADDHQSVENAKNANSWSKAVFEDTIAYLREILQDPRSFDTYIGSILLLIESDSIEDLVLVYKRCIFDVQYRCNAIMEKTFSAFLERISRHPPESTGTVTYSKLSYVLVNVAINWRPLFYRPIVGHMNSNSPIKVTRVVRTLAYLSETIGDLNLWFGLETGMDSFINLDAPTSPRTAQTTSATSLIQSAGNLPGVTEISGLNVITKDYIDLICTVLVGKKNARTAFGQEELKVSAEASNIVSFSQCQGALILELVWALRKSRLAIRHGYLSIDAKESIRLAMLEIEARLSAFLQALDTRGMTVSDDYRLLLVLFLTELVALTEPSKVRPVWLSAIIKWTLSSHRPLRTVSPYGISGDVPLGSDLVENHRDYEFPVKRPLVALHDAYNEEASKKAIPTQDTASKSQFEYEKNIFKARLDCMASLMHCWPEKTEKRSSDNPAAPLKLPSTAVPLLVAVHTCLQQEDIKQLLPFVWNNIVPEHSDFNSQLLFLFCYCADHDPFTAKWLVQHDLYSADALKRLAAISKVSLLFMDRRVLVFQKIPFEIPHQHSMSRLGNWEYLNFTSSLKRTHVNVPFVPPDYGSDNLVATNQPEWLIKLKEAARDIRRSDASGLVLKREKKTPTSTGTAVSTSVGGSSQMIADAPVHTSSNTLSNSWDVDEEEKDRDRRHRIDTMLLLGPSAFIADGGIFQNLRFARYRPFFSPVASAVYSLASVDLLDDSYAETHGLNRIVSSMMMREDPSLLLRLYFNELPAASTSRQLEIFTRLRRLTLFNRSLPTACAYSLFNFLLGFLKFVIQKQDRMDSNVEIGKQVVAILGDLVTSMQSLSFKDFKKGRIEHLVLPNGRVWFADNTPTTAFPRETTADMSNPAFLMSMTRLAQTYFTSQFLLRFPQEVISVRKYVVAELCKDMIVSSKTFIQNLVAELASNSIEHIAQTFYYLSSTREQQRNFLAVLTSKKSFLTLLDVIISFTRINVGLAPELEALTLHVNAIMLTFSDDYTIVRKCLSYYVSVATQLEQLFSKTGFHWFVPALLQLVVRAKTHRSNYSLVCSTVAECWRQFYGVHREAFILQSVASLIDVVNDPATTTPREIVRLFVVLMESLGQQKSIAQNTLAGQIMYTIDSAQFKSHQTFSIEELVKVTVTAVAYDRASPRALECMNLLSVLLPILLDDNASSGSISVDFAIASVETLMQILAPVSLTKAVQERSMSAFAKLMLGYADTYLSGYDINGRRNSAQNNCDVQVKKAFVVLFVDFLSIVRKRSDKDRILAVPATRPESERNYMFLSTSDGSASMSSSNHLFPTFSDYCTVAEICRSIERDCIARGAESESTEWLSHFFSIHLATTVDGVDDGSVTEMFLTRVCHLLFKNGWRVFNLRPLVKSLTGLVKSDRKCFANVPDIVKSKLILPALQVHHDMDKAQYEEMGNYFSAIVTLATSRADLCFDVVTELQSQRSSPSVELLAMFVMPLCTRMLTANEANVGSTWQAMIQFLMDLTPNRNVNQSNSHSQTTGVPRSGSAGNSSSSPLPFRTENFQTQTSSSAEDLRKGVFYGAVNVIKISHVPAHMQSAYLEMKMICLKMCLARGSASLSTHCPYAWVQVANFVRASFRNSALQRDHPSILWSLLDFCLNSRTPLTALLRSFAVEQLKHVKLTALHMLKRKLPSVTPVQKVPGLNSSANTSRRTRRDFRNRSVDISNAMMAAFRKKIGARNDAMIPAIGRLDGESEADKVTADTEESSEAGGRPRTLSIQHSPDFRNVMSRKRTNSDVMGRPMVHAPGLPAADASFRARLRHAKSNSAPINDPFAANLPANNSNSGSHFVNSNELRPLPASIRQSARLVDFKPPSSGTVAPKIDVVEAGSNVTITVDLPDGVMPSGDLQQGKNNHQSIISSTASSSGFLSLPQPSAGHSANVSGKSILLKADTVQSLDTGEPHLILSATFHGHLTSILEALTRKTKSSSGIHDSDLARQLTTLRSEFTRLKHIHPQLLSTLPDNLI